MARKFPKTLHTILEKLDLEHTLYLHLLFVEYYIDSGKYRFRNDWDVDDFCCCYNDMMDNPIDGNVQDCNRGLEYFLEQWYEDVPSRYRTAIRDIKLWAAHEYVDMPATMAAEIDEAWQENGDDSDKESLFAALLAYPMRIWEDVKAGKYAESAGNLFHLFNKLGDLFKRRPDLFKQIDNYVPKLQLIQDMLTYAYSDLRSKVSAKDDIFRSDMDAKLLILQKRTTLFDESCTLWYNMFSEDYELNEESGMWQWYTDRLHQQQMS